MTDGTAGIGGWARGIVMVLMAAGVGWGCSSASTPATQTTDAASDLPGVDHARGRSDARIDSKPEIPDSAEPTPPGNVQFPEPPLLTCARDSDCEFPPPACADPSCEAGRCPGYAWLVYYDNPRCSAGSCVFEPRYFQCVGNQSCVGGGCIFNGTAAP